MPEQRRIERASQGFLLPVDRTSRLGTEYAWSTPNNGAGLLAAWAIWWQWTSPMAIGSSCRPR